MGAKKKGEQTRRPRSIRVEPNTEAAIIEAHGSLSIFFNKKVKADKKVQRLLQEKILKALTKGK